MKLKNRHAIEAKEALSKLSRMTLPIKNSVEITLLSIEIDKQVEVFRQVRDTLISNYQIKVETLDNNTTKFTTSLPGIDEALKAFSDKVNELIDSEGEDIPYKFHVPDDINVQPEILKPILCFVEFNNG